MNANYRYTGISIGRHAALGGYTDPGSSHRLDLTVAKEIAGGHGEILVGVSDVFNNSSDPVTELTMHPTPGRTFFVRMQWKF